MTSIDPISLALVLGLVALVPLAVVCMTAFLKIAVVLSLVRNAIGVQQTPPNIVLYALALVLAAYVMAPVLSEATDAFAGGPNEAVTTQSVIAGVKRGAEPMRAFLMANSDQAQRDFFLSQARHLWPAPMASKAAQSDFAILVPAFVVSELTAAFQIGFLLFLPFIVIDLVVSNILMAMGMMMVSPVTISLPLKLFLFVMVDGWSRLLHGMVLTYRL